MYLLGKNKCTNVGFLKERAKINQFMCMGRATASPIFQSNFFRNELSCSQAAENCRIAAAALIHNLVLYSSNINNSEAIMQKPLQFSEVLKKIVSAIESKCGV